MTVSELFAKRSIVDSENPTAETVWRVFRDELHPVIADEAAAYSIALPFFPTHYDFPSGKRAILQSINIIDIDEVNMWDFKLSYAALQRKEEDYIEYSFSIGLQDVTITHAQATTPFTAAGRVAPDFMRGVNISKDGIPQGVSVGQPTFSFELTKYWPIASITRAYQLQVRAIAGKWNDADYYGLPRGSVKFIGASGKPASQKFPITYRFEVNPNETNIQIGDITVASKLGWEYLDIYTRTVSDTASKKKISLPHSVYVHTLEPGSGDFSLLGLGT
jgi:hypothetical protein